MKKFQHLFERFCGAISRAQPSPADRGEVESVLLGEEFDLWQKMPAMDQRHSIVVMRRFRVLRPNATLPEIRAALLHDVGKIESNLGVFGRVIATVVGPRGRRFAKYHDHEQIGSQMLRKINSELVTILLVAGAPDSLLAEQLKLLREADSI